MTGTKRRITQFAKGYQTAMHEVLDRWDSAGPEAARKWVEDNAAHYLEEEE